MPPVSRKSDPKKLIEYTHMYTYMKRIDIMALWSCGQDACLVTRRLGVRAYLKPFFFTKRFSHVIFFNKDNITQKIHPIQCIHSTYLFHHKIHSHVVPIALPSTITNAILKHIRHFFYYDKINILSMYYIYCVYYNIEIDFLFGYLLTKRYWYMKI